MAEKKKKHTRIHIEHHDDGSHTMHRHIKHEDGKESKESSAHHTLDDLHDGIQQHIGEPNVGEAEADAGDHGVPAAQAGPAGLPVSGGAPAPAAMPGVGA